MMGWTNLFSGIGGGLEQMIVPIAVFRNAVSSIINLLKIESVCIVRTSSTRTLIGSGTELRISSPKSRIPGDRDLL